MSALAALQRDFAEALTAADGDAAPAALDAAAARRFRVYRNNVHHGLAGALGAAYPVVRALVGEDFFAALARAFLAAHPPRSRSLALLGGELGEFLDGFAPASAVPYLGDVARLERAVLEALHAADAPPLEPEALAAGATGWGVHPAARLVASRHPIVAIWRAHQPGAERGAIEARVETALVTRPRLRVLVRDLEPAAAAFAAAVIAGADETTAVAAARARRADFDPVTGWTPLLASGALRADDPLPTTSEN